jgi:uncharacterized membrane protein
MADAQMDHRSSRGGADRAATSSDARMEIVVSMVLRVGVALAALTVLIGGVVYLGQHGSAEPDVRAFHGEPSDLRSLTGVVRLAASGDGRGIIALGVLFLIATPIARVALSVVAFAARREPLYVTATLIVLAVLIYGLVGQL